MPKFRITEVNRDENTNQLSIAAYDFMKQAELNNLDGFELSESNTIAVMAEWIAQKIGCSGVEYINIPNDGNPFSFGTDTANYAVNETDGKKVTADSVSLRQVLKQIAEATQTVCFVSNENKLVFKRLTSSDTAVYNITKNDYFTLKSGDNRRLSEIASITELGDNINYKITEQSGSAQFIRDNPFFELRNDVADILTNAGTAIGTLTINEFDCSWRGNPALEIGDKITLTTKDEKTVAAYLLNDTITFNGGLNQKTEWKYDAEEAETANPTTIGEKLKQTSARVDKQNQIIELQAETIDGLAKEQAQIRIETNKINSCVKQEDYTKDKSDLQGQINANKDSVNESFTSLNEKLTEIEQTPEKIEAKIKSVIKENGAEKVVTQTGFTFDDMGLTVSKSNSELSTTITEDGMTVQRNSEVMLKASNTGVEAKNLNASTFLIIGNRSRFENYKSDFTGCFWIGG